MLKKIMKNKLGKKKADTEKPEAEKPQAEGANKITSIAQVVAAKKMAGKIKQKAIVKQCEKHFPKVANKANFNNLPFAAQFGAMLCRSSYEYDGMFQHYLLVIMSLKPVQHFLLKEFPNSLADLKKYTLMEPKEYGDEPLVIKPLQGSQDDADKPYDGKYKGGGRRRTRKKRGGSLFNALKGLQSRIKKHPDRFHGNPEGTNATAQLMATIFNTAAQKLGDGKNKNKLLAAGRVGIEKRFKGKDVAKRKAIGIEEDRVTFFPTAKHDEVLNKYYNDDLIKNYFNREGVQDNLNFVMISTSFDFNSYIIYDKKSNTIMVIIRGTSSVKSTVQDLKIAKTGFRSGNLNDYEDPKKAPKVHAGFSHTVETVNHRIIYAMKYVFEKGGGVASNPPQLFFTGHSLGGANVTLFAMCFQLWKEKICKLIEAPYLTKNKVVLITWGSPRVGNRKFVEEFNKLLADESIIMLRCSSDRDLIPEIPQEVAGFYHVGKFLDGNNKYYEDKHYYAIADRLPLTMTSINYHKPLYSGTRTLCSKMPQMHAHANAAFITFAGMLKTATAGSGLPKYTLYIRKNDMKGTKDGVSLTTVPKFIDIKRASKAYYERDFDSEGVDVSTRVKELEKIIDENYKPAIKLPGQGPKSKLIPSYEPDGTRVDTETEYGVSIYASNDGEQKVEKVEGVEADVQKTLDKGTSKKFSVQGNLKALALNKVGEVQQNMKHKKYLKDQAMAQSQEGQGKTRKRRRRKKKKTRRRKKKKTRRRRKKNRRKTRK